MRDLNKRLTEVDEVLNYLDEDELKKIPEEIRKLIKDNKDKEYFWKYDENKPLKDQNLSRDTFSFLSYLNMEYLLNDEERNIINQIHAENERKEEKIKAEKYKTEDLFKRSNIKTEGNEIKNELNELSITEYKENFFKRLLNKLKGLFGIHSTGNGDGSDFHEKTYKKQNSTN